MPDRRPCRACGVMIEFVEGPNGKPIPVTKVRNVYYVGDDGRLATVDWDPLGEGLPTPDHFISHFETCPRASSFTRKKR